MKLETDSNVNEEGSALEIALLLVASRFGADLVRSFISIVRVASRDSTPEMSSKFIYFYKVTDVFVF
ncbi:hypothetical protein Hanom_Chr03g00255111 [Helianthus anomalus]